MDKKFENFNQVPPPKKETILNDWDQKHLIEGSKNIILKMYEDFGKNFPDVIILPETAARPLYYLFANVFEKLKKEKDTKMPHFLFFNTNKNIDVYQKMIEEETGEDIKTTEELWQKLQSTSYFQNMLNHFPSEQLKTGLLREGTAEELDVARENMKVRAGEIKKFIENKNLHLAIIDDFISNQNTSNAINKAFGEEIPFYAISGFEGKVGIDAEHGDKYSNPSTGHWNYSYTKTQAIGVTKSSDQKYSTPIRTQDKDQSEELAAEKKQLREEMKAVGENVSKEVLASLG